MRPRDEADRIAEAGIVVGCLAAAGLVCLASLLMEWLT